MKSLATRLRPASVEAQELVFQQRMLRGFSLILLVAMVAISSLEMYREGRGPNGIELLSICCPLMALWCLKVGRVRLGSGVILATGFTVVAFRTYTNGGLFAPNMFGLLVCIVGAGRILGPRWAAACSGLACVYALGIAHLHTLNLIPPSLVLENPYRRALVAVQLFMFTGVLCWYIFNRSKVQIESLEAAYCELEKSSADAARARQDFEVIFRASLAPMSLMTVGEGRFVDCNAAALALMGRRIEDVAGRTGSELGLWRDPALAENLGTLRLGSPILSHFELELVTGDGKVRQCELNWTRIDLEGGAYFLVHTIDLTARKAAEKGLEVSERRFQDFALASGDWFWETDVHGRFTWLSEAIEPVTGYPPAYFIGKSRLEVSSVPLSNAIALWRPYLEAEARRLPFRDFRYQLNGPTGLLWLSASGIPCFNDKGEFQGFRGTGRDITGRVEGELAAQRSDAQLRQAVEELNESFVLCDPQDKIVIANRRFRERNPEIEPYLAKGCTFETYLHLACEVGRFPEAIGREEMFIAERMTARRASNSPAERVRADGTRLLLRDLRLADGCTITMALDITSQRAQEDLLAQSETRLRAMLDNTPAVAVQQYDWSGRVLYWNQSSEELYGFSANEAIGKTLDQLIWTSEKAATWLISMREVAILGQTIGPLESTLTRKDGTQRQILFSSYAVPETGGGYRLVCMDVDISERKRVEEKLKASQKLLEQVMDAIPMSIFVKDRNSNYLMVNQYMADFHHKDKQYFMGAHTTALPTPEATRSKSLRDDDWVFSRRETLNQSDTLLEDSQGNWVPFNSLKIPLFGEGNDLVGLLGINRNITDDKLAQAVLRASESRFSALFHRSPVPQIVTLLIPTIVEDVNVACTQFLRYSRDRLLNWQNGDGMFPYAPERQAVIAAYAQGGTTEPLELRILCGDGVERVAVVTGVKIQTEKGERIAWSFNDLTDQRQAQQQLREINSTLESSVNARTEELTLANIELNDALDDLKASQNALIHAEKLAALGKLVAGIAHELNTPIGNSMLSASTLEHQVKAFAVEVASGLRRSTLNQFLLNAQEASSILLRNLERAAELISSFKQVAADQTSSQRRKFDLRNVIHEVVVSHRPTLRAAKVDVVVNISEEIMLDSFPGPLGQVVGNLLTNAVVHAFADRPDGTVIIDAPHFGDETLTIVVQDNGAGIADEHLGRIFDPFFTTRLGKGGSGLGLNIAHNIVTHVLGGTIVVESQMGRGTVFTVEIPQVAPLRGANSA